MHLVDFVNNKTMPTNRPAQIFEAMHDLVHVYRARMMEGVASIHPELTHNEVRALMFVGRHPGATQKELVQHASADKAQIARLVALLLDKGWLQCAPHEHDKRSRCLHLSPQGQALFNAVRQARSTLAADLLQPVPAASQAQLLDLLEQLRGQLGR